MSAGDPRSQRRTSRAVAQRPPNPSDGNPQNDLCIGAGFKNCSLTSEERAQFHEVVNFAIENNHITPVGALHWLITSCQVDNRQPPVSKEHFALTPLTRRIWTAEGNCVEGTSRRRNIDTRSTLHVG